MVSLVSRSLLSSNQTYLRFPINPILQCDEYSVLALPANREVRIGFFAVDTFRGASSHARGRLRQHRFEEHARHSSSLANAPSILRDRVQEIEDLHY